MGYKYVADFIGLYNFAYSKLTLNMFLIIGTKFITWGSEKTPDTIRCSNCGALARFTEKTGMRFLTLFFLIPTIPLSGKKRMIECPNCKTRFQTE